MIMKHITVFFGLLISLTILSCGQNSEHSEISSLEIAVPTTEYKTAISVERKLIKEGNIEFQTHDLKATRKTIFEAVGQNKAYISSDLEYNTAVEKKNTLVIRVPAGNFDKLLKTVTTGIDKFDFKQITSRDVSEEFLDIEARLKTKKELETRYLGLLKQAKDVHEILEIEKEIGALRSDIESIEGRLKYLQDKISFSTLDMTFYESIPSQSEFGHQFKNGFKNGWDNLISFFVVLINIWPFILIGLGLIMGIRIYKRKK